MIQDIRKATLIEAYAETIRKALFTLRSIAVQPTKVTINHIQNTSFPSVACYTGVSPEEGSYEANIHYQGDWQPSERPF